MSPEATKTGSSFFSSVATVLSGQAACAVLGLAMEVCYARLLGPTGRGQISVCMTVIALAVLVGALGGDAPIVVWTADPRKKISEWLSAITVWGLMGSGLSAVLWVTVYWRFHFAALSSITRYSAFLILCTIPIAVASGYLMSMLAGSERFGLRAGVALADQAATFGSFLLLILFFGRKVETAILGNLIGLAVGAGAILVLLRGSFQGARWLPQFNREIVSGLSMGLRGQPGNLAGTLFYRFDVFLVSYFLGPAALGLYALGVVISEAVWQIPTAVAFVLLPRTARTLGKDATEFTCLILHQVLVIAFVLGLGLAIAGTIAVPFVFGDRFRPSVPVIWWLLPGSVALSLAKVACTNLTARFKSGYSTVFAFIALGVSLALDLVLIPRMGIRGAALASSVAYFTDAVLILGAVKYEMCVSWKDLLVPTYAELKTYRRASLDSWSRLRSLLLAETGVPTGGPS